MIDVSNVIGYKKSIFNLKVKTKVFLVFFKSLLKGDISSKHFILLLRRLQIFVSKMQHNKFVKIGENTKIDLYVPGFSSEAFFTACKKFMEFEVQMPCTTVLISLTSACRNKCNHCYQRLDKGSDMNIELLVDAVKRLQNMGIAFFNIEGGEPFLVYDRLKKVCESIDKRSEIWINSSGDGITLDKLIELKKLNVTGIMFSIHSPKIDEFNEFMKNDKAWDNMLNAIELCHKVDIAVAFNSCLMKESYYDGTFEEIMEKIKIFNACMIQLIKPKSSGAWLENDKLAFSEDDINYVKNKVNKYNNYKKFKDYTSIYAQIIEEDKDVFGCTAGGIDRFYINAKGDVQPCEFLNISFGNISDEDFNNIYINMRKYFNWGGDCKLCEKYTKEIVKIYNKNNLKSLPLTNELSKEVYKNWNRGDRTKLYEDIEKLK